MQLSIINTQVIQHHFNNQKSLDFLSWFIENLNSMPSFSEYVRDHQTLYEVFQTSLSDLSVVPAFKSFSNLVIKSAEINNWLILQNALKTQRHIFYSMEKGLLDELDPTKHLKSSVDAEIIQVELYSFLSMKWERAFDTLEGNQSSFILKQFYQLLETCQQISGPINPTTQKLFDQKRHLLLR